MRSNKIIDVRLKLVSSRRKSPRFCRFNLFLCFVKITFTWIIPASAMYEVGNVKERFGCCSELRVLSSNIDIASIFGEVFTFEQFLRFEVHMHYKEFIF